MSLELKERLDKIRSSPKQQNQQQSAAVLSAVEDTIKSQNSELTPAAYFAALLALLKKYIPPDQPIVNKEVASAVVYLLDLITPHVAAPLLRSKFSQVVTSLAPALTQKDSEGPLIRPSIGCLESLLLVQDSQAWALPQSQVSPRWALAGLLAIAVGQKPKPRKRAQDAITNVLKHPPPSPSIDHPAADMCAESALSSLRALAVEASKSKKSRNRDGSLEPEMMHVLQLIKAIASGSDGWPSKKIDALVELLLNISRSTNEHLTMAAFDLFEVIFAGMANDETSPKLPLLLEKILELQPARGDSQLLPPWIAVLSRGYDVSAQVEPEETFQKLPDLFAKISEFLESPSHNIRISASECLISFMANCVPVSVLQNPSIFDEKALEKLSRTAAGLLSVKYQAAWMEVFNVLGAMFEKLRWMASPYLDTTVKQIGELRGSDSFAGKTEADTVLSKAVRAIGPEKVLEILPLNLSRPVPGQPGRAWLLPIIRDSVSNTRLSHFRQELVPLSEAMFQKVLEHGQAEKTMEIKVFETVVHQIWTCLPGYCDLPLDVVEGFDQSFAEMISNLLYQQTDLRADLCRALKNLVETNQAIIAESDTDLIALSRVSKTDAKRNLDYLATFSNNILAVLFNVYSQTLQQYRGVVLQCINAYLSITPTNDLLDTFNRVTSALETALQEEEQQQQQPKTAKAKGKVEDKLPPTSYTLMDLIITITAYLPRETFTSLFAIASLIINSGKDNKIQKKAYKLIPRLAESDAGREALQERNRELQRLLLDSAEKTVASARHERIAAISWVVEYMPTEDLHFIPAILPEVVISSKEINEKARTAAYDLLVAMGEKMDRGGTIINSKIPNMPEDAPSASASLDLYFTMVSAGLAGSTPHMQSASVTAVTRVFYEFRSRISDATVSEILDLMDMFIQNKNREIVRSVLGFVKVAVISLPASLMQPRLKTLIPNLMIWSHEHKSRFKAKVKHIIERMIRRFGIEDVEVCCPEEDKKLIANIRKTRDRAKRKRDASTTAGDEMEVDGAEGPADHRRRSKFESEFDEAVYGSESDSVASVASAGSDDEFVRKRRGKAQNGNTYIVEDEDEPLDLLSKRAYGNISSTKPVKQRAVPAHKTKAKTDLDGKLLLGDSSDEGPEMMDFDEQGEPGDGTLEGGINAYVAALKGRDAPQRGQKGKLKFSNKRSKDNDDEEDMDVDEEMEVGKKLKSKGNMSPGNKRGGFSGGRAGGMAGFKAQRKGLGAQKQSGGGGASPKGGKGGRVEKRSRGRGGIRR
ncbi:NUC173-domain-containing protein [Pseudovirgaria hyperparasitica]|uniref:NUC173-domain-containing protein n=1 Tax=Pseudovirgaria hyperparasitica TaxID=470096 RepID=A0A6A6WIW9_9PEZI|nr:NUC173-domain-containing protein [Pseudovirgaria hyperparasitica]KAF2762289.1 NUC173-domain-containing protein [Pseudovirgaria hyperparasitica]